ncbi:MAG: phosphotransferase [Melioribacteraceae bacterium]
MYGTRELNNLIDVVKEVVKNDRIADVSVYVGTEKSKNRKLTFLLLDEHGNHLGFLKFPIESESETFIEKEFYALNKLKKYDFNFLNLPANVKLLNFNGRKVLFQESIFNNTRQLKNRLNSIITDAAAELARNTKHYNIKKYFDKIFNDLDQAEEIRFFKEKLINISDYLLELNIPLVFIHGDFVLYNMQFRGNKLYLIDWEYFRGGLPLFDLFHFVFQGKIQIEKKSIRKCIKAVFIKRNLEIFKYYLNKFNLNINLIEPEKIIRDLFIVYLIDNLLFERKIKVNLSLIKSHYYDALKYILLNKKSVLNCG